LATLKDIQGPPGAQCSHRPTQDQEIAMNTLSTGSAVTRRLPAVLAHAAAGLAQRVCSLVWHASAAPAPKALALERNAIHPMAQPLGRTITCETGALWLTFDNTLHDVVLEAGESHTCAIGSRLLIQALHGARLRVD
jgi:hypothetical protein